LTRYEGRDFTYDEVGATRGLLPAGYHHTRLRRQVGRGQGGFAQASDVVMRWDMHRGAGLKVAASGPAAEKRTVVLGAGAVGCLVIPCRVVYVVDEPRQRGFGYGTLPDHPEVGEEAFLVSIDDADRVWLEVVAFSKPGPLLVKVLGPVSLLLQQLALRSYFRSVRKQVSG
jgi:uncharacterized protein (UPF0548 family)